MCYLVGGSLSVPCSLPGPPVVSVFSPLRPGKGGWSLASQRWLEVNDLGRNHAAQQAIIMEMSKQESRSSAGNNHGAEQAGITKLSMQ